MLDYFVKVLNDPTLQVGVRSLEMAVWGGHYNVLANIKQMKDKEEATKVFYLIN